MSRRKTPTPDIDPTLPPPTREQVQAALRRYVENFYDIQELRLQTGGRTYKRPTGVTIELHPSDLARLGNQTKALQQAEKVALADVDMALGRIGFYRDVVLPHKDDWKGLGPTMWGVLLSSFAIEKEDTVSKMWAFAGLRPMPAWRCKGCQSVICSATGSEGFITQPHPKLDEASKNCPRATPQASKLLSPGDVFYSAQSQRPTKGQKLNFNKWLRTKLVGVMGPVILQSCIYRCPTCKERMRKHPTEKDQFIHADTAPASEWPESGNPGSPHAAKCGVLEVGKLVVLKDQAPFTKFYYDYRYRKQTAGWGPERRPPPPGCDPLHGENDFAEAVDGLADVRKAARTALVPRGEDGSRAQRRGGCARRNASTVGVRGRGSAAGGQGRRGGGTGRRGGVAGVFATTVVDTRAIADATTTQSARAVRSATTAQSARAEVGTTT